MRSLVLLLYSFVLVGCDAEVARSEMLDPSPVQAPNLSFDDSVCPTGALEPGDARFCGPLDQDALSKVEALIQGGVRRLVITSPGGREDFAMEIFDKLEAAHIALAFDKFCLSACAHFLFLPAINPHVMDNTLIGLHQTTVSLAMLRARKDLPDHDRFVAFALDDLNRIAEFYDRHGLARSWLVEPTIRTVPTCVIANIDWSNPDHPILGYESEYDFWVPSREMIEKLGKGGFTGKWVGDRDSAQALLQSAAEYSPNMSAFFGGRMAFTTDLLGLEKLPTCESLRH